MRLHLSTVHWSKPNEPRLKFSRKRRREIRRWRRYGSSLQPLPHTRNQLQAELDATRQIGDVRQRLLQHAEDTLATERRLSDERMRALRAEEEELRGTSRYTPLGGSARGERRTTSVRGTRRILAVNKIPVKEDALGPLPTPLRSRRRRRSEDTWTLDSVVCEYQRLLNPKPPCSWLAFMNNNVPSHVRSSLGSPPMKHPSVPARAIASVLCSTWSNFISLRKSYLRGSYFWSQPLLRPQIIYSACRDGNFYILV
ncbi:hypothetical protein C8R43DRAFT_1113961 [Mycena crocata]|nr:hypothetical protein C8R43DRAFT_1113961 [Mycena crocata]